MRKSKERFILDILGKEYGEWQGQVTWVKKRKTQSFRSVMELLKLMDEAINAQDEESVKND